MDGSAGRWLHTLECCQLGDVGGRARSLAPYLVGAGRVRQEDSPGPPVRPTVTPDVVFIVIFLLLFLFLFCVCAIFTG